jgi:hypothetical protein
MTRAVPCIVDPVRLDTHLPDPRHYFSYCDNGHCVAVATSTVRSYCVSGVCSSPVFYCVVMETYSRIQRSSGRAVGCVMCHSLGAQCEYRNQCSISRHAAPFCLKYSGNMTVLPLVTKSVCKYF